MKKSRALKLFGKTTNQHTIPPIITTSLGFHKSFWCAWFDDIYISLSHNLWWFLDKEENNTISQWKRNQFINWFHLATIAYNVDVGCVGRGFGLFFLFDQLFLGFFTSRLRLKTQTRLKFRRQRLFSFLVLLLLLQHIAKILASSILDYRSSAETFGINLWSPFLDDVPLDVLGFGDAWTTGLSDVGSIGTVSICLTSSSSTADGACTCLSAWSLASFVASTGVVDALTGVHLVLFGFVHVEISQKKRKKKRAEGVEEEKWPAVNVVGFFADWPFTQVKLDKSISTGECRSRWNGWMDGHQDYMNEAKRKRRRQTRWHKQKQLTQFTRCVNSPSHQISRKNEWKHTARVKPHTLQWKAVCQGSSLHPRLVVWCCCARQLVWIFESIEKLMKSEIFSDKPEFID